MTRNEFIDTIDQWTDLLDSIKRQLADHGLTLEAEKGGPINLVHEDVGYTGFEL